MTRTTIVIIALLLSSLGAHGEPAGLLCSGTEVRYGAPPGTSPLRNIVITIDLRSRHVTITDDNVPIVDVNTDAVWFDGEVDGVRVLGRIHRVTGEAMLNFGPGNYRWDLNCRRTPPLF
jgi:hypothetical protein